MAYPYYSPPPPSPPPPPPPPPPHAPCSPLMPPPPPHHHHHHHKRSPPSHKHHHHHHPKPPKLSPSPQSPPRHNCECHPPPTTPSHAAPPPQAPLSPPQPYTPPISPQKPPSSPPKSYTPPISPSKPPSSSPKPYTPPISPAKPPSSPPKPCTPPVSPSKPPLKPYTPPFSPSKPPSLPLKPYTPAVSPSKPPSSPPKPYAPPVSPSRPPKPYPPPITPQKPSPYAPIPSPHNPFTRYPPDYYGPSPVPFNSIPPSSNMVATPPGGGGHTTVIAVCVSLGGAFFLAFLLVGLVCLAKKKKKPVYVPPLAPGYTKEHHAVQETVTTGPYGETMTMSVEDDVEVIDVEGGKEGGGSPFEQRQRPGRHLPPTNPTSTLGAEVSSHAVTHSHPSVDNTDPTPFGHHAVQETFTTGPDRETMTMSVEDDVEVIGTEGGEEGCGSPREKWRRPGRPQRRSRRPLPPSTANPTSTVGVGVSSHSVTSSRPSTDSTDPTLSYHHAVQKTVTTGLCGEIMTMSMEDGIQVINADGGEGGGGSPYEELRTSQKPQWRSEKPLPPPTANLTSTFGVGVSSHTDTRIRSSTDSSDPIPFDHHEVQEIFTTSLYGETMTMSMENDVGVIGTECGREGSGSPCEKRQKPDRPQQRSEKPLPPMTANPTSTLGVGIPSHAVARILSLADSSDPTPFDHHTVQETITTDPHGEIMTMSVEDDMEVISAEGGRRDSGSPYEQRQREVGSTRVGLPHRRSGRPLPPPTTNPISTLNVGVLSHAVTRRRPSTDNTDPTSFEF